MRVVDRPKRIGYKPMALILDGDSFTEQAWPPAHSVGSILLGSEYHGWTTMEPLLRTGWGVQWGNVALSGEPFSSRLSHIATNVYPLIATAKAAGYKVVVSCWAGTNDIRVSGVNDPTVILNTCKTYFQACKANGADFVIAHTITPTSSSLMNATQLSCAYQYNLMLRAQYRSFGIDALSDVASDVNMGNSAGTNAAGALLICPNATGYFNDGLHPNTAGHVIASGYFGAAMLSLQPAGIAWVSSSLPTSGPIAGGTTVTIKGGGLSSTKRVTLGGLPSTLVSVTDNQIVCTSVFSNLRGQGDVSVLGPNGLARVVGGWIYT